MSVLRLPDARPTVGEYFMRMAALVATRSRDTSSRVGAVVVDPDTQATLSTGYNGMPMGVNDAAPERYERPLKYDFFEHAEANAIHLAARNGTKLAGATIYVTATPCTACARAIIQSGIRTVVIPETCELALRWDPTITMTMFYEAGINVVRHHKVGAETLISGKVHLI